MVLGDLLFNGTWASALGLTVEFIPAQRGPQKLFESVHVEGRSGDLHHWGGDYSNYQQKYRCWFKSSPVATAAHKIKDWLMAAPASSRLEDTYDSTIYRLATYSGPPDIENVLNRYGRIDIEFDCAPQSYLKSGETALAITNGGLLNNPTARASKPLIVVTGSISGAVWIGGERLLIVFNDMATHTIYIDCEIEETWELIDGVQTPVNAYVTSEYPVITPGANKIEIAGKLTSVLVYPRWWYV